MTRGSNFLIIPPLEDPESAFHKKKDKKIDESSSTFQSEKFESFEKNHDKKGIRYELETESDLEEKIKTEIDEMADITTMTMEEYKRRMCNDNSTGFAPPTIPVVTSFELKGHILLMLKDIPFFGKDHEDAFRHIDKLLDITNYFKVPNVTRDAVLLRMLPVALTRDAKIWLQLLAPGTITTWTNLCNAFIEQFNPPSKIAKLKKKIVNFQH